MSYAVIIKLISDVGSTIILSSLFIWMLVVNAPRTHDSFGSKMDQIKDKMEAMRDREDASQQRVIEAVQANTRATLELNAEVMASRRQRSQEHVKTVETQKDMIKAVEAVKDTLPRGLPKGG